MTNPITAIPAQVTPETGVVLEGINLQLFAVDPPSGDPPADPSANNDPHPAEDPPNDPPADDKPAGAPEFYEDFAMPEGFSFDKESAGDFLTVAKDMNLTQEQAQKLVDLYGSRMLGQQEAQQAQAEQWAVESKKTFKPAEIDLANKTLGKFADAEFISLLTATGLGNHPKMVGLFKNIGAQMSEGSFIDSTSNQSPKSAAEVLYPSMKK